MTDELRTLSCRAELPQESFAHRRAGAGGGAARFGALRRFARRLEFAERPESLSGASGRRHSRSAQGSAGGRRPGRRARAGKAASVLHGSLAPCRNRVLARRRTRRTAVLPDVGKCRLLLCSGAADRLRSGDGLHDPAVAFGELCGRRRLWRHPLRQRHLRARRQAAEVLQCAVPRRRSPEPDGNGHGYGGLREYRDDPRHDEECGGFGFRIVSGHRSRAGDFRRARQDLARLQP